MRFAGVLGLGVVLLVGARAAGADTCRAPADAAAARAQIDATNLAARDAALATQGLRYLPRSIVARGAVARRPAGNVTTLEVWLGCRDLTDQDLLLATDGRGSVYRIRQTRAATQVAWQVCGAPTCEPPCGQPPVNTTLWVALPAGATFRGERSVGWATTWALESHDQTCGLDGSLSPTGSAVTAPSTRTPPPPRPASPVAASAPAVRSSTCRAGARGELACLRRENAALLAEAQRRDELERARAAQHEREVHKLSTGLKH